MQCVAKVVLEMVVRKGDRSVLLESYDLDPVLLVHIDRAFTNITLQ